MKKLAVVVSGWHFPLHFYEAMARQKMVEGWEYHLFCISHRDPSFAKEEKRDDSFKDDRRGKLDTLLYKEIATKKDIENRGFIYKEYPNTIGDWGNTNQWLSEHNYKDYDLFLFTHDDNLILHDRLFADIIEDKAFKKWDILTNTQGMPPGNIRGSFEFFKPKVLKLLGGKFDLSEITLDRTGKTDNSNERAVLDDWNKGVFPLSRLIEEKKLKVMTLSPSYRVSAYCIEGERGYISNTHGINTAFEEQGLDLLEHYQLI